jgi:hypothetical protein
MKKFRIEQLEERLAPSDICIPDPCGCPPREKAEKGNNGVGNGVDPQPPGNPPVNDGPGTGPGNPGNRGHGRK